MYAATAGSSGRMESTENAVPVARIVLGVADMLRPARASSRCPPAARMATQAPFDPPLMNRAVSRCRAACNWRPSPGFSMMGTLRLDSSLERVERKIPACPDTTPRLRPRCSRRVSRPMPRNIRDLLGVFKAAAEQRPAIHSKEQHHKYSGI
jgi:hypothetical protein